MNTTLRSWIPDKDALAGLRQGALLGAAVLVLVLPPSRAPQAPAAHGVAPVVAAPAVRAPMMMRELDFGGEPASTDARRLARWVVEAADNGTRPFAIVDKRQARVYVFEASGKLAGATPVLLGYAAGDDSVEGIGKRPIAQVRPEERTTPAGRFVARSGRNAGHEDVVWVDYQAAVSMHRVRATDPRERRLERLASPSSDDNRISYGCINMPPEFFEQVLWPRFGGKSGIVYVMPEQKALTEVFPGTRNVPTMV